MDNEKLAPICLFTYNRLEETKQTIEALENNFLASQSELFVFSDGWKDENAKKSILEVREYLKTINGFKKVSIIESEVNRGLANSVINGVTKVINEYGSIIVVEDDLITSPNFLNYMNQSLNTHKHEDKVFSVSGFCLKFRPPEDYEYDTFYWGRAHSWGWATWADRWQTIDWGVSDWAEFKSDKVAVAKFYSFGTDLFQMLSHSITGKNDSWLIRFIYGQFRQDRLTVYPRRSKVINIGFTRGATHCDVYNRHLVEFDNSGEKSFSFPPTVSVDKRIHKRLFKFRSYSHRAISRFLTLLMKKGLIKQRIQKLD